MANKVTTLIDVSTQDELYPRTKTSAVSDNDGNSLGNVAVYNATDVISTSNAPVLFVLKDSYHCNAWQNMFFARSEDQYFYVQFPAETMDTSKTYTCASFTGAYKNFINDTSTTVTTGASTEVRFQGGICMAIFPIPTGVGTWTYGAIFPTSHVDITANN